MMQPERDVTRRIPRAAARIASRYHASFAASVDRGTAAPRLARQRCRPSRRHSHQPTPTLPSKSPSFPPTNANVAVQVAVIPPNRRQRCRPRRDFCGSITPIQKRIISSGNTACFCGPLTRFCTKNAKNVFVCREVSGPDAKTATHVCAAVSFSRGNQQRWLQMRVTDASCGSRSNQSPSSWPGCRALHRAARPSSG